MIETKQRVNDSFSVFLRNVKKKKGTTIAGEKSHNSRIKILRYLYQKDSASIDELAQDLHISPYSVSIILHDLEDSNFVKVQPETETVSLTDSGRTAINYQDLLTE